MNKLPKCKSCGERGFPKNNSTIGYYCEKAGCQERRIEKALEAVRKKQLKENREELKKWNEERKQLKEKLKTHKDYMADLQIIFNKFIRLRDFGKGCISCGVTQCEEFHAGHFLPSTFQIHRFNEFNVNLQCSRCNTHLRGNSVAYRIELIKKIGLREVEKLEETRHTLRKFSIPELKAKIEHYKAQVKILKERLTK